MRQLKWFWHLWKYGAIKLLQSRCEQPESDSLSFYGCLFYRIIDAAGEEAARHKERLSSRPYPDPTRSLHNPCRLDSVSFITPSLIIYCKETEKPPKYPTAAWKEVKAKIVPTGFARCTLSFGLSMSAIQLRHGSLSFPLKHFFNYCIELLFGY